MNQNIIPSRYKDVVKSDTVSLPPGVIGLYVGTGGTLVVKGDDDEQATFNVQDGHILPGQFKYVMAASTADGVVALRSA